MLHFTRRNAVRTAAVLATAGALTGLLTMPAYAQDPSCKPNGCQLPGWINSGYVNIRAYAGTQYAVIGQANRYDNVTVRCYSDDQTGAHWDLVYDPSSTGSHYGFVRDDFVYTGGDITTQVYDCLFLTV